MSEQTIAALAPPWVVAANSLSYDHDSLLDLNVADVEKLVKEACTAHADQLRTAALAALATIDEHGWCPDKDNCECGVCRLREALK